MKVFLTSFLVAIVDIKTLVLCINGFLRDVLELLTSASERKASPLEKNSCPKEAAGRHEIPLSPGRRDGERLQALHNMILWEELFLKVHLQGALQSGFVQAPT